MAELTLNNQNSKLIGKKLLELLKFEVDSSGMVLSDLEKGFAATYLKSAEYLFDTFSSVENFKTHSAKKITAVKLFEPGDKTVSLKSTASGKNLRSETGDYAITKMSNTYDLVRFGEEQKIIGQQKKSETVQTVFTTSGFDPSSSKITWYSENSKTTGSRIEDEVKFSLNSSLQNLTDITVVGGTKVNGKLYKHTESSGGSAAKGSYWEGEVKLSSRSGLRFNEENAFSGAFDTLDFHYAGDLKSWQGGFKFKGEKLAGLSAAISLFTSGQSGFEAVSAALLSGNDKITASSSPGKSSILNGFLGNDLLIGGPGDDFFEFSTLPHNLSNIDTIRNFTAGSDKIQLDSSVFTALAQKDQPLTDFIKYQKSTGKLFYDEDGTGSALPKQFALVLGSPDINGWDYSVV